MKFKLGWFIKINLMQMHQPVFTGILICNPFVSLRKQLTFRSRHLSPRKMTFEKWAQKFHTDDVHDPVLASASDWLCQKGIFFQPIRRTTKIWVVHVISMEFLLSLLRRHFARAQVATSQNVSCFFRLLTHLISLSWNQSCNKLTIFLIPVTVDS